MVRVAEQYNVNPVVVGPEVAPQAVEIFPPALAPTKGHAEGNAIGNVTDTPAVVPVAEPH